MIAAETRIAVKADIRAHLLAEGANHWTPVLEKHPTISKATFWRLVKEVRSQVDEHAVADGGVSEDDPCTRDATPIPRGSRPVIGLGFSVYDLYPRYVQLFEDADLIRAKALDSKGQIQDPVLFEKSCRLRERLYEPMLQVTREMRELRRMEIYFQSFSDAIEEASPELQLEVLHRLRALREQLDNSLDG